MQKEISIIVPIYNPAIRELEQCFQSISALDQEIEVILVDDGSSFPDVKNFCKNYTQRDNRFRYYHQKNKGVSSARNLGLSKATGKFVTFIDADDYVNGMAWKSLTTELLGKADLVLFDVCDINPSKVEKRRKLFTSEAGIMEKSEVIRCFALSSNLNECWGKLYSLEKLRQHNVLFPVGIRQGEDFIFNCLYLQYSDCIYYVNEVFYHYNFTYRNTSLRFVDHPCERLKDVLLNYKYLLRLIEKTIDKKDQRSYFDNINSQYTDGFGSILLLLSKHEMLDGEVKEYIRKEVKPLIIRDPKSIFKKSPKAFVYDLILRNDLWFALKILSFFKRATI